MLSQEGLRQHLTCSTSHLRPRKLLRARLGQKGRPKAPKLKAAEAMAALVSGMLIKALKIGGMAEPQFSAVAGLCQLWAELLHPAPARADVEALRTKVAEALCVYEGDLPVTEMVLVGEPAP